MAKVVQGKGWANFGTIHTVPIDDLHPHALTPGCACGPTFEHSEDVIRVVHNSFDGREFSEPRGKLKAIPIREAK